MKNFPLTEHSNITLRVGAKWRKASSEQEVLSSVENSAAWPPIAATTVSAILTTLELHKLKLRNKNAPNGSTSTSTQTPLYVFMLARRGIVGHLQKVYFEKPQPKHLFCIDISRLSGGYARLVKSRSGHSEAFALQFFRGIANHHLPQIPHTRREPQQVRLLQWK